MAAGGFPRRVHRAATKLAAVLAVAAVAACQPAPTIGPATSVGPGASAVATPLSSTATEPPPAAVLAAAGPWRSQPFKADTTFAGPFVAGCRTKEPAIASLPLALIDVQGLNVIFTVYGTATSAYVCRSDATDPASAIDVKPLTVPAGTPTGYQLDVALYERFTYGTQTGRLVVGRLGADPRFVIGGWPNETYVFAAFGGGWYAVWWEGDRDIDGISTTDGNHVVQENVHPKL